MGIGMGEKELVNEESDDDDEGYHSISNITETEDGHYCRRRRKPREDEFNILEENTKEEIRDTFILLKEAYDDLKDEMIKLEFQVDCLKDEQDEREEEMRVQRTELMQMVELLKVMQEEKKGDKKTIKYQKEIIDKHVQESGGCLEEQSSE